MSFRLHYDKNYGIYKRKGWSIAIDGHFYVEFERFLIVALVKAFKMYRSGKE
jgi:hypothetical protein